MPEKYRVLVVDDDEDALRQISEHLNDFAIGEFHFASTPLDTFGAALEEIKKTRFDLVVLDVLKGPAQENRPEGRMVLQQIRELRFLPVVFNTAIPKSVEDLISPVVRVSTKSGGGFNELDAAITEFQKIGLLELNKAFHQHVDRVLRNYLWQFLPEHWQEIITHGNPTTLAYILCRRLAASLNTRAAEDLAKEIGAPNQEPHQDQAHPMQFYILPATEKALLAGDILKRADGVYFIVITPSCDFEHGKAEFVLLCRCVLVNDCKEFIDWHPAADAAQAVPVAAAGNEVAKAWKPAAADQKICGLLNNNPSGRQKERFCFLPGVLDIPDMLVDYQQTLSVPIADISDENQFKKVAAMDSPFREGVTQKFTRFMSRIGYPDIDERLVLEMLRQIKQPPQQR